MGDELLYRLENRVAVLTLNRPERMNALTKDMMGALRARLAEVAADEAVGCVVLTGAGQAFCAGGDVRVQARVAAEGSPETPEQRSDALRASMEASRLLHEMPKPTIAMLNGVAAGAGLSLALACDLRIAGRSARMTTAFAKVGLSGDYGGTWFLTQLIGTAKARELYFLSDVLDAVRIEALGLANRVVADEALVGETMALAERLASGPAVALRYMKRNLNVAVQGTLADGLDSEAYGMLRSRASEDKRRQVELALEQAHYEVGRSRRQYDAVDPDNRLVAAELETRWNERLTVVRDLEAELEELTTSPATEPTPADRERLMMLGADLQRAWTSAGVTPEARKRIVRTLIDEIVVRVEDNTLDLVIRWHGGDHSALKVKKNRTGQHRWSVEGETIDLVRVLARQMPDKAIASVLNRAGKTTGRGNGWTQSRVCSLRSHNAIPTYREGERRERGEVTLDEAAAALSVSPSTVRRLIKDGQLSANQLCKGAPWIIRAPDLDRSDVKGAATARRLRRPPSSNPLQKTLEL